MGTGHKREKQDLIAFKVGDAQHKYCRDKFNIQNKEYFFNIFRRILEDGCQKRMVSVTSMPSLHIPFDVRRKLKLSGHTITRRLLIDNFRKQLFSEYHLHAFSHKYKKYIGLKYICWALNWSILKSGSRSRIHGFTVKRHIIPFLNDLFSPIDRAVRFKLV